jgi:hypothetical protein
VGNSITRGLLDPDWETITISGANWYDIIEYVLERKDRFINSLVYVHIGPVRFSELVFRVGGGTECRLRAGHTRSQVSTIFRRWNQQLLRLCIFPVICTLYPMCFLRYNRHLGINVTALREAAYTSLTRSIKSLIVRENQDIVDFNMGNNLATPYMHRRVYTRRRGHYVFRENCLTDGLHPDGRMVNDWKSEIKRTSRLNRAAVGRRRRR